MNVIKKIVGLFSVMEDEVRSFRLLFLQSLFIGFANSYYYIVSSSFLLKNVDIKILPNAYIITGTAGFFLVGIYKRLQRKYGISGSFKACIILFSIVCFFNFYAMLELSDTKAFAVFLAYFMVLFAAPFTAIFSLGLFAQCSRLYNIAQSKRLLALVISGEIISSVIAYLSISFLSGLLKGHVYVLLPVAGVFGLCVLFPFSKLQRFAAGKFSLAAGGKAASKVNFSFFKKDRFYLLIGVATIFSVFAIYVVDYAYLISVRYMADVTGLEIAAIVSVFFFAVKIGELAFSFLSGRILSSRGVKFSLLMLPVVLLLFAVFAFVSGYVFTGLPIFLLAFLFLSKLIERAVRKAITTPSVKVMYQVAEPHERLEIESSIDGLLSQLATIFSGVLLLVISLVFFGDDKFTVLHLFSFVCMAAFALWSFSSLKMYDSYRVKIKDFLSALKAMTGSGRAEAGATPSVDAVMLHDDISQVYEKIDTALGNLNSLSKDDLLHLIKVYNPKQALEFKFEKDDRIAKRLVHLYYNNNLYFSRLLIIRFLKFCNDDIALKFMHELWDVSDITGRLELILAFNEKKHKHPDPSFFERHCEECVKEITWTDAAMHDTAGLKDDELLKELRTHKALLTYLLFELLKPLYDASVIQVIYDIITREDKDIESRLFALELLDITLHPGLKEMIKPMLEPIPYEDKRQKLGKIFHVYQLPAVERLVDILMKDYNLVSLKLKEVALIAYSKASPDKSVLSAFKTNSIDNLKFKAEEIHAGFREPACQAKLEILKRMESKYKTVAPYTPYLFNHALSIPRHHKSIFNAHAGGSRSGHVHIVELRSSVNIAVKFDYLGLALLMTLKQKPVSVHVAADVHP